ncbi:MAG: heparinase II/III family protein [Ginsengibacter sp.]
MNKIGRYLFFALFSTFNLTYAQGVVPNDSRKSSIASDSLASEIVEPCTYADNFEDRALGAWASYPFWQDNAYDQNFRVNEIIPGDPNLSIVQKVTPYSEVDNYAGAQKLLDMYLVPGSTLRFRYYLKTNETPEFFKVRFAAGNYGKVDFTLEHPETNKWVWVNASFEDFVRENPAIAGVNKIRIYALAFLAKIPHADPSMPIYLGLDDITFKAARPVAFRFSEPEMYKLPEFTQYIPKSHYYNGSIFKLSGSWPKAVKRVTLEITSYTDTSKSIYKGSLSNQDNLWVIKPIILSFPDGLYLGNLVAYGVGSKEICSTQFTIHIAPKNIIGQHPRLLFNADKKKWLDDRFKEPRFKSIYDDIAKNAKIQRDLIPVKSLHYDLDQFPDENWLPSATSWKSHFLNTGDALWWNSLAYQFHGDHEAGEYAKNILLSVADWPNWGHPWQIKRGRFSEHNTGTWSHRVAEAYDLTYDLMTVDERAKIRKAIMRNIVEGVHRTYIYNNNVIANSSNWLAATVGGSLINMAAIYGDGNETENIEPYFTGALMKLYSFINNVTDSKGGAWGEGLGYNTYSFSNLCQSVPSIKNVFNIDLSKPLVGSYNEYIWAGILKKREFFNFGDGSLGLIPLSYWAFLLNMQKEPRLSWFYNYLKQQETFEDVLYDNKGVQQQSPLNENPDKIFHEIGTTVFKSGWQKDDFCFVMRTGAFYNHQHMDQGSFWLADHGIDFIKERGGSAYYDDPLYQSWFIQPVSHSTILINGNQQSQRIGDELKFAPGFEDHAFISQSLDGKDAAFSSGEIGPLYWDKVKSLSRNVLYLKPRTLLMLDVAKPGPSDVDVTLLYQSEKLKDIDAGQTISKITKGGFALNIIHLAPEIIDAKSVETPHYLNTLINEKPLIKEGMLSVTARTKGAPLVIANLLTTTPVDSVADVKTVIGKGCVTGVASGRKFAFTTIPGSNYKVEDIETDALAMTWNDKIIFAAETTMFQKKGVLMLACNTPVTFEFYQDSLKYDCSEACKLTIGVAVVPRSVVINGVMFKNFKYYNHPKTIVIEVPKGEGIVLINK